MKLIPLSGQHGIGKYTMVDDEDFNELIQWKWAAKKRRNKLYAYRNKTIQSFQEMREEGRNTRKSRKIYMHRVVLNAIDNDLEGDHIDGNSLNNQKSNLRLITHAQNKQNEAHVRGGHSQHRGVSYDKSRSKKPWIAQGCLNRKRKRIGRFETEEEAHQAAAEWRKANLPYSSN